MTFVNPLLFVLLISPIFAQTCPVSLIIPCADLVSTARGEIVIGLSAQVRVQSIVKTVRACPIRETAEISESVQLVNPTSVSMDDVQDRPCSACIILLPIWSLYMSQFHRSIRFRSPHLALWVK